MKKNNSIIFAILLAISALSLATMAAIFSITGIAMLYSGAKVLVSVSMIALEFAKVMIATFLYRYWHVAKKTKIYLIPALFILIMITSVSIYGYLTNSYTGTTINLEKIESQITLLNNEKTRFYSDRNRVINERQQTIENKNQELSGLIMKEDSRYLDSKYRAKVYKRYQIDLENSNNNLQDLNRRINQIEDQLGQKKLEIINIGSEVGPFIYMARLFNIKMDDVMKWFTLIIVLVFDPLAVILIVVLNLVLEKIKIEKQQIERENQKIYQAKPINEVFDNIEERIEKSKVPEKNKDELELENIKNVFDNISFEIPIDNKKEVKKVDNETEVKKNDNNFKNKIKVNDIEKKVKKEIKIDKINNIKKEIKVNNEKKDKIINSEDIETYFDNAVKEVKKKQLGQIEESMYAPGGGIRVNKYKEVVKNKS